MEVAAGSARRGKGKEWVLVRAIYIFIGPTARALLDWTIGGSNRAPPLGVCMGLDSCGPSAAVSCRAAAFQVASYLLCLRELTV